jgi:hypothetical protein
VLDPEAQPAPPPKEECHSPQIKEFIEQIEKGEGKFYSFFKEVIESAAIQKQEPVMLKMEKKRAGFTK